MTTTFKHIIWTPDGSLVSNFLRGLFDGVGQEKPDLALRFGL